MNNIEILEEFINKQKNNKGTFVPTDFEITAIENLIQENKELKKENLKIRDWKYVIDTYQDLDKLKQLDLIKINGKEYISKDKIKEKIEELEKLQETNRIYLEHYINILNSEKINEVSNKIMENYRIKTTLQELLVEGE